MTDQKPKSKYADRPYEVGRGKPPVRTQFKKGAVGNPSGKKNSVLERAKKLTREEHERITNALIKGTVRDINDIVKDPHSTALEVMVASLIIKVIRAGDITIYEKILDRLLGPIKQEIEMRSTQAQVILTMPANGSESNNGAPTTGS